MTEKTRITAIAIAAAAGVAVFGLVLRGLAPELYRYLRMKRM